MQRKDQGLPILLYPLQFSVDNLSWPLRSGELCSRALGQDTGSRPPLGGRHGAGARRPARSVTRQAGDPGSVRRSASRGDRGRRVQAYWEPAPHGLLQPLPGHGWETASCAPPAYACGTLLPPPWTWSVKNSSPSNLGAVAGWTRD